MLSSFFWKKLSVRLGIAPWFPSVKRLLGGGEQFLHYLSDRALAVPVVEMLDPAWFPDVQGPDSINLALGAPRCELPLGSLRGMNDRRALSIWGLPDLREEVAQVVPIAARQPQGERTSFDPADEVLITQGASGAFAAVIDTFINPGAKVVLFDPTAPIFPLGLQHRRARVHWVETWMEDGKTRFDIEGFAQAMRGARLLALADPVNPTGGVFAPEDLEQIAWWAKKHDVLIYLDESFAGFRYEADGQSGAQVVHLAGFPNAEQRLLIAGSVSKTHGLGSARVGWLLGRRNLLRPVAATAALAAPFVSPFCQQVALTALRTGAATATATRDEFAGRRGYLFEALQGMGLPPRYPAGGFFFWVPVNQFGLTGREFARQLLLSQRVLVNPGEPFGPSGEDFIRLSYATEEGRLREGLQRLSEFMEELRTRQAESALTGATLARTGGTLLNATVGKG